MCKYKNTPQSIFAALSGTIALNNQTNNSHNSFIKISECAKHTSAQNASDANYNKQISNKNLSEVFIMSNKSNPSRSYGKHINKDHVDTSDKPDTAINSDCINNLRDYLSFSDNDDKHLLMLKNCILFNSSLTYNHNTRSGAAA